MQRTARFLALLLAGLAVLTGLAYVAIIGVTREWFEKDLRLRTELAAASARWGLTSHWSEDRKRLTETLADITRDERIMGAAACSMEGKLLAATEAYPPEFSCKSVLSRVRKELRPGERSWTTSAELPSGRVQLGAAMLETDGKALGAVLVVHDVSFIGRREATTRNLLLTAFFVLSLGAAVITLLAARVAWRSWTRELRRALSGHETREFQPLVRDVRALVDRLASERESEARTGPWNPERLRSTLKQRLHGERVVVLANREPYVHEAENGGIRVLHPASGLVTALEPVMRACSGVWVAHGSGTADRATADARGHIRVPPGEESYLLRRVWLTEEEEAGYYYGFSNEGLWPLCHVAHARPAFRAEDWEHYVKVNQRFAAAVCEEVDSDDPIVLVQDYHFALAPRLIRERLPRATVITFWHIPFPNAERFGICPWREEIISGLLGSSIVGFHTQAHCNQFLDAVDTFVESRIDRVDQAVVLGGSRTLVRAYPISVEWPTRAVQSLPPADECRREVLDELGLHADAILGVGVDRLDYTKGLEERIEAVERLLERRPDLIGRFTFVQLAAPSRTRIPGYQQITDAVEEGVRRINARFGSSRYAPVILLREHHEPDRVYRYYRAAHLCYVSSLHDGMNLVSKEFIAAREDEQGVLVLSQFTGAAHELPEALIVNPYDLEAASEALEHAIEMPRAEQADRMRALRATVEERNVYRWAGRMLLDAAQLRQRARRSLQMAGDPIPGTA